jgi:hypothetical protein
MITECITSYVIIDDITECSRDTSCNFITFSSAGYILYWRSSEKSWKNKKRQEAVSFYAGLVLRNAQKIRP